MSTLKTTNLYSNKLNANQYVALVVYVCVHYINYLWISIKLYVHASTNVQTLYVCASLHICTTHFILNVLDQPPTKMRLLCASSRHSPSPATTTFVMPFGDEPCNKCKCPGLVYTPITTLELQRKSTFILM